MTSTSKTVLRFLALRQKSTLTVAWTVTWTVTSTSTSITATTTDEVFLVQTMQPID